MTGDSRRVLVWRERLLPISETFISNHLHNLQRWEPTLAGSRYVTPSLPIPADAYALFGQQRATSAAKALQWRLTGRNTRLQRLLEDLRPQIIHAHFGPDATYVLPTAARNSLPMIATFHGADATSVQFSKRSSVYRRRLEHLFAYAHSLHAVSDFIAARLLSLGAPADKVKRIYIGTTCEYAESTRGVQDTPYILFVGRLVEKKGLGDLLTAVSMLKPELRDTPVHIVGDGPLRQKWETEARSHNVKATFHGGQPSSYVSKLMQESAIFCVPSKTAANGDSEGLGMVFLEAGLHALPTVTYRHGGIPEIILHEKTGLLAPEGNIGALAENLSRMLTDGELRRRYGDAARERVTRNFNITHQIPQLEQLYDDASGRNA